MNDRDNSQMVAGEWRAIAPTPSVLASEFERAVKSGDLSRVSHLIRLFVAFLEVHALDELPRPNRVETRLKAEWGNVHLWNVHLDGEALSRPSGELSANVEARLSDVLLGAIDEIVALAAAVPELSRDNLLNVFSSSGYLFSHEEFARYDRWRKESSPESNVQPTERSPEMVIGKADELAKRGEFAAALVELASNPGVTNFPGISMRVAEWNSAIGDRVSASRAALKELLIRPDHKRALEILLADQDALIKVISEHPPSTIVFVNHILNLYSQQRG